MKNSPLLALRIAALTATAVAMSACADKPTQPVVKDSMKQVEATVEAVDPQTRMVLVRGPNGPATIVAGPEVRNFENVHVGDRVVVSYYQGIAAQMKKGASEAGEPVETTSSYRAPEGARPAGAVGRAVTTTVKIESVDTSFDTVTFRRQDGFVRTLAVESPDVKKFIRTLSPGDEVEVTYTEAVAVEVVPGQ